MNRNSYSQFFNYSNRVYKFLLLLLIVCASTFLFAESNRQIGNVLIIIPKDAKPYQSIVSSLKRELIVKHRKESVRVLNLGSWNSSSRKKLEGNRLIITLGAQSLDYYLRSTLRTPFIASFITEAAFSTLITKNKRRGLISKKYVGGISLEQPSRRIISLVKLIQKKIKSIGVVLGPNTFSKYSLLDKQVRGQLGGVLKVAHIRSRDNPVNRLRNVFKQSQLVIIIPDKARFNRNLARWVVTLSYKHKVPVISYSKKYAEAGALISLYSEPDQIGRQTAGMLVSYLQSPNIKPLILSPPRYFQIAINQSVRQAFGLNLPDEDTLLRQLYRAER